MVIYVLLSHYFKIMILVYILLKITWLSLAHHEFELKMSKLAHLKTLTMLEVSTVYKRRISQANDFQIY